MDHGSITPFHTLAQIGSANDVCTEEQHLQHLQPVRFLSLKPMRECANAGDCLCMHCLHNSIPLRRECKHRNSIPLRPVLPVHFRNPNVYSWRYRPLFLYRVGSLQCFRCQSARSCVTNSNCIQVHVYMYCLPFPSHTSSMICVACSNASFHVLRGLLQC